MALSRRYGNGGVEQTSENYDGDTDENANILGLEVSDSIKYSVRVVVDNFTYSPIPTFINC